MNEQSGGPFVARCGHEKLKADFARQVLNQQSPGILEERGLSWKTR